MCARHHKGDDAASCCRRSSRRGRRGTRRRLRPHARAWGYVRCPGGGACVLNATRDCGACSSGPRPGGARQNASGVAPRRARAGGCVSTRPSARTRLDYLVAHDPRRQIQQLQDALPASRAGVPAYQWLADDQHGAARARPARPCSNGVGLGATLTRTSSVKSDSSSGTSQGAAQRVPLRRSVAAM